MMDGHLAVVTEMEARGFEKLPRRSRLILLIKTDTENGLDLV
jgi:hypothetical protein